MTTTTTNWNDTLATFEITNWTDVYPGVEQMTFNETMNGSSISDDSSSGSYTFTDRHVAMAWVPHITGLLSLIGSSLIVWDVYYRKHFQSVYHRLLFGLAVSDIIASLGMALSTWPVPIYQGQKTWGAIGNIQSCEFQGFIIQLGLATPLYNAALSIYYVMLVKFNWKSDCIHMIQFERISHVFAISLAIITATISLAMKQYNNANIWCWIAPYPYGCEDAGTCERGNYATIFRMAFYFAWLWMSFIIVTVCMIVLACAVITQTHKMDRYGRPWGQRRSKIQTDRIRNVVLQSALYIMAFLVTALPLSIARIYQAKYSCSSTFFPLSITTVTVFPLQGFWNAMIYFRPKITKHLRRKRVSAVAALWSSNSSSISADTAASRGTSLNTTGSSMMMFHAPSSSTSATGGSSSNNNLQQHHTTHPAPLAKALAGLDFSDTTSSQDNEEGDDTGARKDGGERTSNGSWCIAELQQQVAAIKNSTKIQRQEEEQQQDQDPTEGSTIAPDDHESEDDNDDGSSEQRLPQEHLDSSYQSNDRDVEDDLKRLGPDDQGHCLTAAEADRNGGDVEMDGSKKLLNHQQDMSHSSSSFQ